MKFLIDANLGRKFTNLLNRAGHDAVLIKDLLSNASDEDILSLANSKGRIIVTNDKDFGEFIFKLGKRACGVILLRTFATDSEKRFEMVRDILDQAEGNFIVVREGKVRIRKL